MKCLLHLTVFITLITAITHGKRSCQDGKPTEPYPQTVKNTTVLLQNLRELMRSYGVHGYFISSTDDHQTEYVAPWFKRLAFITGYTGSVGTAVVTMDKAAVWVDGRYFEQVEMQVDCNWDIQKEGLAGVPSISEWMTMELTGKVLGIDPKVMSISDQSSYLKKLGSGITWKHTEKNLIDEIWSDRPKITYDSIFIHYENYTGQNYTNKIDALREKLSSMKTAAIVIQELDDVAWLLNLRGNDVPYVPFFYAYVIVTQNNISLFVDQRKITEEVRQYCNSESLLAKYYIKIQDYNETGRTLKKIINNTNEMIWITPQTSVFIASNIPKEQQFLYSSPVQLPKAKKNRIEIEGMKSANIKDGVAIMQYFVWLKEQIVAGKRVTEISGSEQLAAFKREQHNFRGLSFPTISAFGAHGSIIHYKADNFTDVEITDKSLYLLDSGAQFPEGSTDISRTIHLGSPTEKQRERFTMVLQGVIGLASVIFPQGTYGGNIDAYAREYLWHSGLDYRHGTGHGIGSFLSIHEGPSRIRHGRTGDSETSLYEGMVFSDEPGYYETGEFGIRLESAICVQPVKTKYKMEGKNFYGFEFITWIPFDRKLINFDMLENKQIDWLNNYYKDIRKIMGPEIQKQGKQKVYQYMIDQTEPITKPTKQKSSSSLHQNSILNFLLSFFTYVSILIQMI